MTGVIKGDQEVRIVSLLHNASRTSIAITKSVNSLSVAPTGAWLGNYGNYAQSGNITDDNGVTTPRRVHSTAGGATSPEYVADPIGSGNFVAKYPDSTTTGPTNALGYSASNANKRHSITFILKFQNGDTQWTP